MNVHFIHVSTFRCTAEVTNLRQERVNLQEDISRQRQLEEKKLNLDKEVEDLEKAVEELRDEKRPFEARPRFGVNCFYFACRN